LEKRKGSTPKFLPKIQKKKGKVLCGRVAVEKELKTRNV